MLLTTYLAGMTKELGPFNEVSLAAMTRNSAHRLPLCNSLSTSLV